MGALFYMTLFCIFAFVGLEEENGNWFLKTNIYQLMKEYCVGVLTSDALGCAFEPEQRFENPDGSDIVFDRDYFGTHRGLSTLPGPFSEPETRQIVWNHKEG